MTIETTLETIDQLAIGARVSFLAVRYNIDIVIRLSKKIDYPNHPWSQSVQIIGFYCIAFLLIYKVSHVRACEPGPWKNHKLEKGLMITCFSNAFLNVNGLQLGSERNFQGVGTKFSDF